MRYVLFLFRLCQIPVQSIDGEISKPHILQVLMQSIIIKLILSYKINKTPCVPYFNTGSRK